MDRIVRSLFGCEGWAKEGARPDPDHLRAADRAEGAQGHIRLHGIILQASLVAAGDVGAPNDSGTRVVTLVE